MKGVTLIDNTCTINANFNLIDLQLFLNDLDSNINIEFLGIYIKNNSIANIDLKGRTITFKKCQLSEDVDINFYYKHIKFNNCFSLKNHATNINFSKGVGIVELIECDFKELNIKNFISINHLLINSKIESINVESGTVLKVEIPGLIDSHKKIIFQNIKFQTLNIFTPIGILDLLSINATMIKDPEFTELYGTGFSLSSTKAKTMYIHLRHCDSLRFRHLESEKFDIIISESEYVERLSFSDCNFTFGEVRNVVNNLNIGALYLDNCSSLYINNINISIIKFENAFKKNVDISNCTLDMIDFKNFRTYSSVYFNNITLNGYKVLTINNSILKSVEINPSFFHHLTAIHFKNSSIRGLELFNFIDLDDKIFYLDYNDLSSDKQTLYREIKDIAEISKNNYLYQKYKSLEYQEILNEGKQNINITNRIILYLNDVSNKHGTSPFYSLGWFGVLILFYTSILKMHFGYWEYFNLANFINKHYTLLLNPFQYINSIDEYKFPWWIKAWDIVYNISIGYLIYQFVASFRKFNR